MAAPGIFFRARLRDRGVSLELFLVGDGGGEAGVEGGDTALPLVLNICVVFILSFVRFTAERALDI